MFKNLKITPKLILCFVIAVTIASISGIIGVFMLITTDDNYSSALVVNGFSQGQIGSFNTYLNKGGAVLRDIVLQTDAAAIKASQDELTVISQQIDAELTELKPNCQTAEEKALIATIEQALSNYRGKRDMVIELGLKNFNDEAMSVFYNDARPYLNEAMTAAQSLADLNVEMGTTVSANLTQSTKITLILIITAIVAAFAISLIFAVVVSRSIAKSIIAVQKAATQLEQGDLAIHVDVDSKDEIGMMASSFNAAAAQTRAYIADISRALAEISGGNFNLQPSEAYKGDFKQIETSISTIITSLSETMRQITIASSEVFSGSNQVSSAAQALSQGATEQASSVEELSATITEISDQVKSTAQNALLANSISDGATTEVSGCNQQMHEMNIAMKEINDTSAEIGKIIKTIEDIAFQTNILALNAAVEAARAGASGKGFAVVADEVRNLASKSAEAAKNTTALIESSIRAVENGTRLANATTESLQRVVAGSQELSTTISKISSASNEQASSIAQVTVGVEQISAVVQNNSATAEESAAASEELNSQAQMLNDLVGQFKLLPETAAFA